MKPKYLQLSPSVRIKHVPPARHDDGIRIPERRVQPVDVETAKRRLSFFVGMCAASGSVSMFQGGNTYGTIH